jgi:hypothetical protein
MHCLAARQQAQVSLTNTHNKSSYIQYIPTYMHLWTHVCTYIHHLAAITVFIRLVRAQNQRKQNSKQIPCSCTHTFHMHALAWNNDSEHTLWWSTRLHTYMHCFKGMTVHIRFTHTHTNKAYMHNIWSQIEWHKEDDSFCLLKMCIVTFASVLPHKACALMVAIRQCL